MEQKPVRIKTTVILCVTAWLAVTLAIAQSRDRRLAGRRDGRWNPGPGGYRQWGPRPRPVRPRSEFPTWEIQPQFQKDVFTFVRIQYDSHGPFGWWDRWDNDYPDSDLNFSFRLQQLTSLD